MTRCRPTVHFGDDTSLCDLSDAEDVNNNDNNDNNEGNVIKTKEFLANSPDHPLSNQSSYQSIPKKNLSIKLQSSVPIIKV